jgi:hypothetical protein
MDERLCRSFLYLLQQAEQVIGYQFTRSNARLAEIRNRVITGKCRLNGFAYALHTMIVDQMRNQRVREVVALLRHIPDAKLTMNSTTTISYGDAAKRKIEQQAFTDVIARDYDSAYSKRFDAAAPATRDFKLAAKTVEAVLRRLQHEDSETNGEIAHYVSHIVIIKSEHINAGTCFKAFGLLYLTILRPNQDWTCYLENIVHEAGHHHLFALWTLDPILRPDGGQLYRSPLRTEPRPMSGIFHAMFVLARTIRVLRLFRDTPKYSKAIDGMTTGYNQAKNPATLEEKFDDCCRTIQNNARLTPIGAEVFASCRKLVNQRA